MSVDKTIATALVAVYLRVADKIPRREQDYVLQSVVPKLVERELDKIHQCADVLCHMSYVKQDIKHDDALVQKLKAGLQRLEGQADANEIAQTIINEIGSKYPWVAKSRNFRQAVAEEVSAVIFQTKKAIERAEQFTLVSPKVLADYVESRLKTIDKYIRRVTNSYGVGVVVMKRPPQQKDTDYDKSKNILRIVYCQADTMLLVDGDGIGLSEFHFTNFDEFKKQFEPYVVKIEGLFKGN